VRPIRTIDPTANHKPLTTPAAIRLHAIIAHQRTYFYPCDGHLFAHPINRFTKGMGSMKNILDLLAICCDADLRRQATIAQLCEHVTLYTLLRMSIIQRLAVQ
jgi:hypothetical protein